MKIVKEGPFSRLEGDHQALTFGVLQLVDAMQPGGAKVNISFFG